jgi:hypothetical protein
MKGVHSYWHNYGILFGTEIEMAHQPTPHHTAHPPGGSSCRMLGAKMTENSKMVKNSDSKII